MSATVEIRPGFRMAWPAMLASGRGDILCCAALLTAAAIIALPGALVSPMELWDESRNATNAMEMANSGDWLVTTFEHAPDRWNTKPPLLIWIMAALLRSGLPAMLALRLPSLLAAMTTIFLVYATCRVLLHDRLAGLLGGSFLCASILFMGDHVARTGDYDALLALLSLGFVLCVGRYIDGEPGKNGRWIAAAAALLFLSLMTKGAAAALPVPGLIAYAIARRRVLNTVRDWRAWAAATASLSGFAFWAWSREQADPGFLAALWANDVTGRAIAVSEGHFGGPLFYPAILLMTFPAGVVLLPALFKARVAPDPARRHLCLLTTLTAASWFGLLTAASTKIAWYAAPILPLLAIAIGASAAHWVRLGRNNARLKSMSGLIVMCYGATFWYQNVYALSGSHGQEWEQLWYVDFVDGLRGDVSLDGAVIVDRGLANNAGFQNYNPIARFAVESAARRGEHLNIVAPGSQVRPGETLLTCDPVVRPWLMAQGFFTVVRATPRCLVGHIAPGRAGPRAMAPSE